MTISVLTELCLMCFDFHCQEEALHIKITLASVQGLLLENTLLNVFLQKTYISQQTPHTILRLSSNKFGSNYEKTQISHKQLCFLPGISNCATVIETNCQNYQLEHQSKTKSLQPLLLGYLSMIQLMGGIRSNSLLYHDVLQILKYITLLKSTNQQKTLKPSELPFTKNRIQRTVKQLREKIAEKKNKLNKVKLNSANQTKGQFNVLRDLTNEPQSLNRTCYKNESWQINRSKNNKPDDRFILKEVLKQSEFFINMECIVEEVFKSQHISDKMLSLTNSILSQIQALQKTFIQRIQDHEMQTIYHLQTFYIKQSLKENFEFSKISLNPEKSHYPIIQYSNKPQTNRKVQQIPEYIEFAYIEGLPFPTNRRTIDFSLLQLTDSLLLSYLLALEKFKDLEEICIRKNKLTLIGYQLLKNVFPNLRSIDLRQNVITSQIADVILDFKHLNILYLSQCEIHPVLLIKIGINLQGINVLYCDRLNFFDSYVEDNQQVTKTESSELKGIFYIMCLNLKKLMYFSLKGYFSDQAVKSEAMRNGLPQKKLEGLTEEEQKQMKVLQQISETIRRRHGILEI